MLAAVPDETFERVLADPVTTPDDETASFARRLDQLTARLDRIRRVVTAFRRPARITSARRT
jgi:hypothetical protein